MSNRGSGHRNGSLTLRTMHPRFRVVAASCARCGADLTPDDAACPACGAAVEVPRGPVATSATVTGTIHSLGTTSTDSDQLPKIGDDDADLPPGTHVLVVTRGPSTGMRLELTQSPTSVGRSAETAIFLDDITVSRQHAQFEIAGAGWILRDLGSLNGTYVNRHQIEVHELASGDEIQIGKYRFKYLAGR